MNNDLSDLVKKLGGWPISLLYLWIVLWWIFGDGTFWGAVFSIFIFRLLHMFYLKLKGGQTSTSVVQSKSSGTTQRMESRSPELVISLVGESSAGKGFSIPLGPKPTSDIRWISKDEEIVVAGIPIPGGLLYVGKLGIFDRNSFDPCVIDLSKSVGRYGDFRTRQMDYWPSYSTISDDARRSYLNWLADGRKHPDADWGFVFLFFYGLERRVIYDAQKDPSVKNEFPIIVDEIKRLLSIYGKSNSFQKYATKLLDWIEITNSTEKVYLSEPPALQKTYEVPFILKLAVGQASRDQAPIPASWALMWARHEPSVNLRTPAFRCEHEFNELYVRLYKEKYGAGMVIKPNRTKLSLVYFPASANMRYTDVDNAHQFGDIPDVSVLTGCVNKLTQIAEMCTDQLDAYSRYIGKNPDASGSLVAALCLPSAIWPEKIKDSIQVIKAKISDGLLVLPFGKFLESIGGSGLLGKRPEIMRLVSELQSIGIAMEPDFLLTGKIPKEEDHVVLFSAASEELSVDDSHSPAYQKSLLTIQLASAVATADKAFKAQEINAIRENILSLDNLTRGQKKRLIAHIRLLVSEPASLASLKKKLEPLDQATKESIAGFMVIVAQSDGIVSPEEVKLLEKIYKVLSVDTKKVFSDIHAVATDGSVAKASDENTGFTLDMERIAKLQQDTEKVNALLSNIFIEEAITPVVAEITASEIEPESSVRSFMGLNENLSAFARLLMSRISWARAELTDAAADLELLLDGALEEVNTASFDTYDIPFFEGDDPIEINPELMEKIAV